MAIGAPARAAPASVVVEIDGAAERVVDARSARRLIPLEVSDVAVPVGNGARGGPLLFFRVLGRPDGSLRIELWERGEYHGARALTGAGENPQLVARRVALAAAELARRLARKREGSLAREEKLRRAREAKEKELRERTQDGPLALRAELGLGAASNELWLFGQQLSAELTLRGPLRIDVGGELWGGALQPGLRVELQGVSLGPAYRLALTRRLDLDVGARAAALLLQVPSASALDGVVDQDSSWTAKVVGAARLQLGLSRQVRLGLGLEAGGLLRSVSYTADGPGQRLGGFWWGASLGLVVTPSH